MELDVESCYGNSANIPSGRQFEGFKPFYSLKWTKKVIVSDSYLSEEEDLHVKKIAEKMFLQQKAIIDPLIEKDIRDYSEIRIRKDNCRCTPVWNNQEKKNEHNEDCPKSWK